MTAQFETSIHTRDLVAALLHAPEALEEELDREIGRYLLELSRPVKRDAPKAFSILVNSVTIERPSPYEGTLGPHVDYAQAVEEGTGLQGPQGNASGKMPPRQNIKDWIKVKRIEPNDPTTSEDQLAFLIARSIAMKGTRPQPYLGPNFESTKDDFGRRINEGITRALKQSGGLH